MAMPVKNQSGFSLRVGQTWNSFERFRLEGEKILSSVKDRVIATLHTKAISSANRRNCPAQWIRRLNHGDNEQLTLATSPNSD